MINLKVTAQWTRPDGQIIDLDPALLNCLNAIQQHGSLTKATQALGASYRTLWALVKRLNAEFEEPVIETHGRAGANLTPLGWKILWMAEQGSVRVLNEVSAAAEQLNSEWKQSPRDNRPWLSMALGDAPLLRTLFSQTSIYKELDLYVRWQGGISALSSLHRGEVKVAGCHLPLVEHCDNEALHIMRKWLRGENLLVAPCFQREVGWMSRPSRKRLNLYDVAQRQALLVNRSASCPTHHLLNGILNGLKLNGPDLPGFYHEENSHLAAACSIAAGHGDLGLGIREAAEQYNLRFDPIGMDQYFLVFSASDLEFKGLKELLEWLTKPEAQMLVQQAPGYCSYRLGQIFNLEEFVAQLTEEPVETPILVR